MLQTTIWSLNAKGTKKLWPLFHCICIFIWYFIQVEGHAYASFPVLCTMSNAHYVPYSLCNHHTRPTRTHHAHPPNEIPKNLFFFFRYIFTLDWSRTGSKLYIFNFFSSATNAVAAYASSGGVQLTVGAASRSMNRKTVSCENANAKVFRCANNSKSFKVYLLLRVFHQRCDVRSSFIYST